MTTKRFTIDKKGGVYYLFDNENLIPISDGQPICDLLNTLHEENEQLKTDNGAFIQDIEVFKEENTHLKLENEESKYNYNEKCNEYCGLEEQVDILLKENEKLKSDVYDWKASAEDYLKLGKSLKKQNEQLKQDNNALIHLLENQSMIIEELHSKLLEYQVKEPIALTKEDLNLMGKAISYYTHGRYAE